MSALLRRARELLSRPNAWLDEATGGYALRLEPDRRRRAVLRLDEAAFRALVQTPGLKVRPAGGWIARAAASPKPAPPPGRPGLLLGERSVTEADGSSHRRAVNVGESPLLWLNSRRLISPREAAAGERLRADTERAASGPSLTMRWDALPQVRSGAPLRMEPGDAALAAGRRAADALAACPPRTRAVLGAVCVRGTALTVAESELGLRRRSARPLLREGLTALADHYRLP
jgi:hypothetical protein